MLGISKLIHCEVLQYLVKRWIDVIAPRNVRIAMTSITWPALIGGGSSLAERYQPMRAVQPIDVIATRNARTRNDVNKLASADWPAFYRPIRSRHSYLYTARSSCQIRTLYTQ